MRIAYFTLDEVNQFLVRCWARPRGFRVDSPKNGQLDLVEANATVIVLDHDSLSANRHPAWVRRVLAGDVARPVLVHGHNISDAELADLRRQGVRVCRGRLRKSVFQGWLDSLIVDWRVTERTLLS